MPLRRRTLRRLATPVIGAAAVSALAVTSVWLPSVSSAAQPSSDPRTRVVDLVFRVVDLNADFTTMSSGGQITISLATDVLFDFGSAQLAISGIADVTKVAAQLKSIRGGTLQIYGYTDSVGSDAVNRPLSQHRAQAVAKIIEPLLASTDVSFDVKGLGSANPVAPNTLPGGGDNPKGRAQNRRVTLHYVPAGASPSATGSAPTSTP